MDAKKAVETIIENTVIGLAEFVRGNPDIETQKKVFEMVRDQFARFGFDLISAANMARMCMNLAVRRAFNRDLYTPEEIEEIRSRITR